jgi:hypothetical protein
MIMTGFIHTHVTRNLRTAALLALGLTAGVAGFAPSAAMADDDDRARYGDRGGRDDYRYTQERRYDKDRDHDRHDRHHHRDRDKTDVKVEINIGGGRPAPRPRYTERRVRYWVEPEYRTVSERVWVEPVYKVVTERVWVEPVYQTVYEEVRVPARYEVREVSVGFGPARVTNRERVLIEPARIKRVAREVCVSEGRWNVIERRVCVSEGRWNVVHKHVCVNEGRWDYRVERVEYGREAETRVDFRF